MPQLSFGLGNFGAGWTGSYMGGPGGGGFDVGASQFSAGTGQPGGGGIPGVGGSTTDAWSDWISGVTTAEAQEAGERLVRQGLEEAGQWVLDNLGLAGQEPTRTGVVGDGVVDTPEEAAEASGWIYDAYQRYLERGPSSTAGPGGRTGGNVGGAGSTSSNIGFNTGDGPPTLLIVLGVGLAAALAMGAL